MKKRLLLVDDDKTLSSLLGQFLEDNNYNVSYAYDGGTAISLYKKVMPDMILLDLDLPVMSGIKVAEIIRSEDYITPIILMSGTFLDEDYKIKGYELGAINFIDKPVPLKVLLAQIESKLYPPVVEMNITIGQNLYRLRNQILFTPDQEIHLMDREALILSLLFEHQGEMISKKKIFNKIWGHDDYRNNKSIDTLIYQLKKKLEVCPELKIINLYSKGYILEKN